MPVKARTLTLYFGLRTSSQGLVGIHLKRRACLNTALRSCTQLSTVFGPFLAASISCCQRAISSAPTESSLRPAQRASTCLRQVIRYNAFVVGRSAVPERLSVPSTERSTQLLYASATVRLSFAGV